MKLIGSICALATPFCATANRTEGDSIDFASFRRLIDWQIAGGTRAVVVAGSTGEAAALDDDEFAQLVTCAADHVARRIPVLAGTGMQSTRKTIAQTRRAASAGANAALVVTPPYVRPTQEGLYRHFSEVAEFGGLPVILYNVPSRTACDLLPGTSARLAGHGNIVGIKEANAEARRMQDLLTLQGDRFSVLSGDDPICARAMLAGAAGVISVAANVAARAMRRLHEACVAGRTDEATSLDKTLGPLYALLGVEPNPIPVKWCLQQMGICDTDRMRLPLLSFSAAHHAQGRHVLQTLDLVGAARAAG